MKILVDTGARVSTLGCNTYETFKRPFGKKHNLVELSGKNLYRTNKPLKISCNTEMAI